MLEFSKEEIDNILAQNPYEKFKNFPIMIHNMNIEIPIKLLSEDSKMPTKAHDTDAGFDLYSVEEVYVGSLAIEKIKTGIAVNIPAGYVGLIQDRSGMGSRGFKVHGGVIDAGYTGEIMVCIGSTAHNGYKSGEVGYTYLVNDSPRQIPAGSKIAQLVILPLPKTTLVEVTEFEETERGEKGFGSSGQ
jgi:dUTP pyrophosphatase